MNHARVIAGANTRSAAGGSVNIYVFKYEDDYFGEYSISEVIAVADSFEEAVDLNDERLGAPHGGELIGEAPTRRDIDPEIIQTTTVECWREDDRYEQE
jgi:hypothetical protein